MIGPESRHRLILLAIGLLVLLGPVIILIATLGVLVFLGDLAVGRITPIDFLELYLIDLVLTVGLAYGIYRLTLWLVVHQVPESLSVVEAHEAESTDDETTTTEER